MGKEIIGSRARRNIYDLLCVSPSRVSATGTQGGVLKGCPQCCFSINAKYAFGYLNQ